MRPSDLPLMKNRRGAPLPRTQSSIRPVSRLILAHKIVNLPYVQNAGASLIVLFVRKEEWPGDGSHVPDASL